MGAKLRAVADIIRPKQWIKNFALFAPLFFSGSLFYPGLLQRVVVGFVAFCCLSSSGYVVNDILDAAADRKHPYKKNRPLAEKILSPATAWMVALTLTLFGLWIAQQINPTFFTLACIFLFLRCANALLLRRIGVVDVLVMAVGYMVRVYAGVAVSGTSIPIWLSMAVLSLSLFLAIAKRRAEYTLLGIVDEKTLFSFHYSEKLLNTYAAMFATSTFLTYAYYSFLAGTNTAGFLFRDEPGTLLFIPERKWMMVTIPFVLYGIMRYLQIVYEEKGGTLETIVTHDRALKITAFLWFMTAFFVIYGIGR